MTKYFLGIDIGGTKSHALIADENGQAIGFGVAGPGNYENVGWDGFRAVLNEVTNKALTSAGIPRDQIAGAGFGVAGYDWPNERSPTLDGIATLGLECPIEAVNDTIIGLLAGAKQGWGVVLVAGTSNNCRGRDQQDQEGRVTGKGIPFGEFGGASEIVWKALHAVAYDWNLRGPTTQITEAFVQYAGAKNISDLLEGLRFARYTIGADAARLVFQIAEGGDEVARQILDWAGRELAGLAIGVIRQLEFQNLDFEIVLVGSTFKGGPLVVDPLRESIHEIAHGAQFVRLTVPPVIGAVVLGMDQNGMDGSKARKNLIKTTNPIMPTEEGKNNF